MKRFLVYFHYDPLNLLDEPCRIVLKSMHPFFEAMLFVTNSSLQENDRNFLRGQGIRLLKRDNTGFDVGAYRDALVQMGREELAGYDELVMMNYTLAGPVHPLQDMFACMDARKDLDFWGLSRHYPMQSRRFGGNVPEHLQSHFIAVRRRLFQSDPFWDYWQKIRLPKSYEESVVLHETRFTSFFAALGYRWDSYLDTEDLKDVFVNPIMACPKELLQHRGSPFFKRRSFFTPYTDELRRTDGMAARELYDYLKQDTGYPVDRLLQCLLQTQSLVSLSRNLHWRYILPEQGDSVNGEEILLLGYAPPWTGNETADHYLRRCKEQALEESETVKGLFAREPMLGILAPELPNWPRLHTSQAKQWHEALPALRRRIGETFPLDESVPPMPNAGIVFARRSALPASVRSIERAEDAWLLPLLAQKNGYFTATFLTAAQAAAGVDTLHSREQLLQSPRKLAAHLARLAKHTFRDAGKRGEGQ